MGMRLEGGFELDTGVFELRHEGERVPLEPQAFDVLCYLVAHRDRAVAKEELMDAVWGGRFVSETAVTSRIKQVRRALGDDGTAQRMVRTHHGRGYRFVGGVEEQPGDQPPIRYTVSDGLHIAYQVSQGDSARVGSGAGRRGGRRGGRRVGNAAGSGAGPAVPGGRVAPTDIVLISGFVSHLELDWADPRHAHFLDRLAGMGRLIRFDKRGTGMSDRPSGVPDLETRMHDVIAVMDAVGSERAVLFGYSEGGPMAVLMAAMRPERVAGLVLYASYARRTWAADYPWAPTMAERDAFTEHLVTGWDWEEDLQIRSPSADAAMRRWWTLRMRAAATPSTVRALMDMNNLIDVRDVLPSIRVPTLVVHRRDDQLVTLADSEYLAAHIPGARLVVQEGVDHFMAYGADEVLDVVEPFVAGLDPSAQGSEPHVAVLAAVVAVSGRPHEVDRVVAALGALGGRCRTAAGRSVVLFDGPATAVRTVARVDGGSVGVGLAIAEVPREGDLTGPGIDAALWLADGADAGELATSETARVLLAGSTAGGVSAAPSTVLP